MKKQKWWGTDRVNNWCYGSFIFKTYNAIANQHSIHNLPSWYYIHFRGVSIIIIIQRTKLTESLIWWIRCSGACSRKKCLERTTHSAPLLIKLTLGWSLNISSAKPYWKIDIIIKICHTLNFKNVGFLWFIFLWFKQSSSTHLEEALLILNVQSYFWKGWFSEQAPISSRDIFPSWMVCFHQ